MSVDQFLEAKYSLFSNVIIEKIVSLFFEVLAGSS
jgi:hypothetical protein